MFFPEGQVRVHLYGRPVDMRRSFDGLSALTSHTLSQDPTSGALFVFINRRATQMKVLYWDRTGYCVWAIVHSLIVICRLHEIDPNDYLVDVLQRVCQHPASKVDELTPRLWKQQLRREPAAIGTAQVRGRVNDAGGLPVTLGLPDG